MLKFTQGKLLERYFSDLDYPEHIGAYVPGRTTRSSAEKHAGKHTLIIIDLKDFFPSTRRSWVRRAIQSQFGYPHQVAGLMSDLMTVPMNFHYGRRYVVPQGAPTSGAICNWVANHRIDGELLELCERWGMAYTRYADDLAFSHQKRLSRGETNKFIRAVRRVINAGGYSVNEKKLRVARSGRQQRLLGMTINEKPNIMRTHYRQMRARLHDCKLRGFDTVARKMGVESGAKLRSEIEGKLAYYHMINPTKAAKLRAQLLAAVEAHE